MLNTQAPGVGRLDMRVGQKDIQLAPTPIMKSASPRGRAEGEDVEKQGGGSGGRGHLHDNEGRFRGGLPTRKWPMAAHIALYFSKLPIFISNFMKIHQKSQK